VTALALTGCLRTPAPLPTSTLTTPTANRVFTVMTAQPATTTDPAGVKNDSDSMVVLDLFQRLMLVQPSTQLLKPDLAKECLYTAPTVFECSLPKGLLFTSGHPLTSSDVKFSLQRAMRLAPRQLSLLGALRTIETTSSATGWRCRRRPWSTKRPTTPTSCGRSTRRRWAAAPTRWTPGTTAA
jgi:peptide/nickel transport system substrate-binding protein